MSAVDHPMSLRIYDVYEDEEKFISVREMINGSNLKHLFDSGKTLEIDLIKKIAQQLLEIL